MAKRKIVDGVVYNILADRANVYNFRKNEIPDEIVIPDRVNDIPVKTIERQAFEGAPFTSVILPGTVTSIDAFAFLECEKLVSVTIQSGVTYIGKGAFWKCTALKSITIPGSVTIVDSGAFRGCKSLEDVIVLNPECQIAPDAFIDCEKLG